MSIRINMSLSRRKVEDLWSLVGQGQGSVKVTKHALEGLLSDYGVLLGRAEDTGTEIVFKGDKS